jgi:DNA-binding transcriptional LysR family regulator
MMRGSDFSEMTAFVEIAEHGSFASAAKHLGVAVSTLSHRIRKLEERLGVRLLNRTTRSVALTAAGQTLLGELQPVFLKLSTAIDSIGSFGNKVAGHLRLTVAPPAAESVIGPLLAKFLTRYPAITSEISVNGASVDIVRERFDAGIRLGALVERDMVALAVGPAVRFMVVASPQYIARRGQPLTPADLKAHDCIRMRLPSGALLPWRFQSDDNVFDFPAQGSLVINDRELELRVVLSGAGMAHALSNRFDRHIAEGRLISLLEDHLPPPVRFFLYHPSRRQTPPVLRALIDFFREEARNESLTIVE